VGHGHVPTVLAPRAFVYRLPMQTALAEFIRGTPVGEEADAILRACVHCGFCNATCPTYQLLGNELDGPRGRIYLIKGMLEGAAVTRQTLLHLDRCLSCRACETTCPSGVRFGRLADIGRQLAEEKVVRPVPERLARRVLRHVLTERSRFAPLVALGRLVRPLLPAALRRAVSTESVAGDWPAARHARRMLVLDGCVQPELAPGINAAAARVLDALGISLVRAAGAGCCGALSFHNSGVDEALDFARRNIDAWWPDIEAGCEAIVMTASGCGVHVKEYGHLLKGDAAYAAKAARVAALTRDIGEILATEDLGALKTSAAGRRIAFHAPCSLQHGQKLGGVVEKILRDAGFALAPVPDAHLCCGAAGTYSILQPVISRQLRARRIAALESGRPEAIVTANIGCLTHLAAAASVPVRHWIELLDTQQR
jgi:glycolate oxidase iron-sulfur subunit